MKNIAVIGAGTMGNGIAQVFGQFNYQVNLIDISRTALDQAVVNIAKNLDRMIKKEKISGADKERTLHNISTFTDMKEGIKNSELVIEAATENPEIKINIFKELDKLCDANAILATNTSSISITRLGAATKRPDKVIGMHFMNPVPVMQLIEVIRGYSTSDEVTNSILDTSRKIGKTPTEVNDYPGFIANRILMPMLNEAIYSLFEGVGGVEEIDTVMKLGMAHPMGPLQLADFIGLDVCLSILRVMHDGFGNPKYAPCPLLVNMVAAGSLGVKSGEGFYHYQAGSKEMVVAEQFRRNKK